MKTRVLFGTFEAETEWPEDTSPAAALTEAVRAAADYYKTPHDGAWLEFG